MNLTPKSWNMQSEITAETVKVNDVISYTDCCNSLRYRVLEVSDTDMVIQSVDNPEWIDVKTFKQLNKRWRFSKFVPISKIYQLSI